MKDVIQKESGIGAASTIVFCFRACIFVQFSFYYFIYLYSLAFTLFFYKRSCYIMCNH